MEGDSARSEKAAPVKGRIDKYANSRLLIGGSLLDEFFHDRL